MENKIAIVTGGANGIGRGIAKKMIEEGVTVIVADIDEENGAKTVSELTQNGGNAWFKKVDLRKDDEVKSLFDETMTKHGRIDILVCNAGVQIRDWAIDFDMDKFDFLMGINLRAYYLCSKIAAGYMKKQGGGSIVCISSVNSMSYHSKRSPYNISKAAINGMVGTLAVEWGRYNIRINAVAPGYVLTEVMESGIREGIINEKNILSVIPMKRYIEIEEIGSTVWFLASQASSGITGQVLCVDGGWSKNALPEQLNMM